MSLDIRIKQGTKTVYNSNFYGFIHFDKPNRHELVKQFEPQKVTNFSTFKQFIEMAVEPRRQKFYLDLINISKPVSVTIY